MVITIPSTPRMNFPSHLTDDELVAAIPHLAGDERRVTARLVAHLAELDKRQLVAPAGYSSLYTYCREALGYSEDETYIRKTAARVARRYPVILDMLADGRLGLTTVRLLAPVLSDSNCDAALTEAAGASKCEVEKLVARLNPRPDVPATVRRLPTPVPAPTRVRAPAPVRPGSSSSSSDSQDACRRAGDHAGTGPAAGETAGGEAPGAASATACSSRSARRRRRSCAASRPC